MLSRTCSAVFTIAVIALVISLTTGFVDDASHGLMRDMAQAGVGLLIAYSVAVAAAEPMLGRKSSRESHESWLGVMTGIGLSGLLGIAVALLSGNEGNGETVSAFQASWVFCSIGAMGLLVAVLPIASYSWREVKAEAPD